MDNSSNPVGNQMSKQLPYQYLKSIKCVYPREINVRVSNGYASSLKLAPFLTAYKIYTAVCLLLVVIVLVCWIPEFKIGDLLGMLIFCLAITLFISIGVYSIMYGFYIKFYPNGIETYRGLSPKTGNYMTFRCGEKHIIKKVGSDQYNPSRSYYYVYIDGHRVFDNLYEYDADRLIAYLEFYLKE